MRLLFHTIRHSAVYDILSFRALRYSAITCSRIFRHSTVSPFHCSIITSNRDLGIVLRILVASQTKRLFCALSSIKFFFSCSNYHTRRRGANADYFETFVIFWSVTTRTEKITSSDQTANTLWWPWIISSLVRTCQTSFPLKRKISTVHVVQKGTSD